MNILHPTFDLTTTVHQLFHDIHFNLSETMSVPTFHYIQVQLYQYYEMVMMEKKEAKIWAKRYVVNSGSVVENPGAFINHYSIICLLRLLCIPDSCLIRSKILVPIIFPYTSMLKTPLYYGSCEFRIPALSSGP